MGFRTPTQPRVNLKDLEGRIVALQAISWQNDIPVRTDTWENPTGQTEYKSALLARVAAFGSEGAEVLGESLIFYPVVQDMVQKASPDWTVGTLGRRDGEHFEYFVLEDLPEDEYNKAVARFQSAGIN